MAKLKGRVALITGGARGQGAAEARRFAAEGALVVITDVLADEGKQVAADTGGLFIFHDVTSEDGWRGVVEQILSVHGRIDVLVNNAGIMHGSRLVKHRTADWDRVIAVNQTSVFLGMRAVAPVMIKQRSGVIINISSVAAWQAPYGATAYAASKAAVIAMTKVAAKELGPQGIRVNTILPGVIETEMIAGIPEAKAESIKAVPLGRGAQPEEVASMALFLASDEGSYCTGQDFVVDGGMYS